jgi:hypothetical protein
MDRRIAVEARVDMQITLLSTAILYQNNLLLDLKHTRSTIYISLLLAEW